MSTYANLNLNNKTEVHIKATDKERKQEAQIAN